MGSDCASLELWSCRSIRAGEQLLVFYGTGFHRDYLVDHVLLEDIENVALHVRRGAGQRQGTVTGLAVGGDEWTFASSQLGAMTSEELLLAIDSKCTAGNDCAQNSPARLIEQCLPADARWAPANAAASP